MALDSAQVSQGTFSSADGTRIAYRAWRVPNATHTFAVVHGHGEHGGRYDRFAQGMAQRGLATYALDLRGHGDSEGQRGHVESWSQWVDDAVALVQKVETEATNEVVPLGHSFGGVVMLSAARSGKLAKTKRFILSSPALRLTHEVPAFLSPVTRAMSALAPKLTLSNNVDAATISRIDEVVEAYRTDPLVHNKITARLYAEWRKASRENLAKAGDIRLPFLILAGTADQLIDPESSRELHRQAPTSELRLLEGRYHEPFNDLGSGEVFDIIADWLRR